MIINRFLVLLAAFILFACSVNDPKLPDWETEWKIYIPSQDLIMGEEIINDTTFISGYDNDSIPIILFNLEDSTDWERVEASDLVLEPKEDHFDATIGDIELGDYGDLRSDSTLIPDILPPELFLFSDSLLPFDTMTVYPPDDSLQFSQYLWAHIAEGELWITFCNETFLSLRAGVTARVYNENGGSQFIGEVVFTDPIDPHSSQESSRLTLNNRTIYNEFRIEYTIPIESSPVTRYLSEGDRNGYFCTILSVGELIATEAMARIPEQSEDDASAISIEDQDEDIEHRIISGTISSGNIQFDIQNTLPVDVHITLELPNFLDNGSPKTFSRQITAGMNGIITESISGCEIINHRNPGTIIDSLDYIANVASDSTDGFILFSAEDSVVIDVVTDSIYLASIRGVLDTVDFDIDEIELDEIDVFEDIEGQIRLNELEMQLIFENEIDLPINVDLRVVGRSSKTQDSVVIDVSETILPVSDSPITIITIDDSYSNPSIVDLLAILPNEITVDGGAVLYGEGGVSVGDGLRVQYQISSPLTINISESLTFDSEIDSITYDDLDEDQRDQIVNDMADVDATFNFINHVPIGASLKYYMAVDSTDLFSDVITDPSRKIIFEADIDAGIKNPTTGFVQTAVESSWDQQLTDEQLEIFNFPTIYTRQELIIGSTDGEVKIRQDDSIEIEAILEFKITIKPEGD